MSNLVQLPVEIGVIPPSGVEETRQQFAEAIASRLLVYLPTTISTFVIGGAKPTSDEGPWFKEVIDPKSGDSSYELWVWSDTAADYVLLTLNQVQLRYWVGNTQPSSNVYDVWVKTATDGAPLGVLTYNLTAGAWEPVSYTPAEVDAFFEGEDSGKKQVDWDRVINKPTHAVNAPRSVSGQLVAALNDGVITNGANYNWEIVYHINIGGLIIFDPNASIWKTVDGVIGDLKVVSGLSLGTDENDFTNGFFSTIYGKHPGWQLDSASQGRAIVGANPLELWDTISGLFKSAGSIHGVDEQSLQVDQLPPHVHTVPIDAAGTDDVQSMIPSANADESITGGSTGSTGSGDPISNVQKSIAYYILRKAL